MAAARRQLMAPESFEVAVGVKPHISSLSSPRHFTTFFDAGHVPHRRHRKPPQYPQWTTPYGPDGKPLRWIGRLPTVSEVQSADKYLRPVEIPKETTKDYRLDPTHRYQTGGQVYWPPHENERLEWTQKDIEDEQRAIPHYSIEGPGKYAACFGQSGLYGIKSKLIRVARGVFTMKEAARRCDATPGCTHFSWTAGPAMALPYEPLQGFPYRLDLCKGEKVIIDDFPDMNTFVGVRGMPPSEANPRIESPEFRPDGPITAISCCSWALAAPPRKRCPRHAPRRAKLGRIAARVAWPRFL
mmetsp:Transcript_121682/g.344199  ORF Transcript_121682/g.344199 Transcript_121682/m.344199 type:complete len:299 (-) Transcript_121682:6-902(-)